MLDDILDQSPPLATHRAVQGADDSGGDRRLEPEGAAHRDEQLPHTQCIRVAQRSEGQVPRGQANQGQVGGRVVADEFVTRAGSRAVSATDMRRDMRAGCARLASTVPVTRRKFQQAPKYQALEGRSPFQGLMVRFRQSPGGPAQLLSTSEGADSSSTATSSLRGESRPTFSRKPVSFSAARGSWSLRIARLSI